ncbi:hypothetical protein Glove_320g52 [Diversispora epigaea]|uniref:Protein kinase domain-containing protein n=1 Tax=Diversispora epigaea TaxID=1348612 RepID=A0A397HVY1_9GLOM|nr:hypothetical protein Glove_320g52 [Diversispora epigaea]
MSSRKICPECNQEYVNFYGWCKPCYSKHFQNDFNNWTSGNDKIDKFIQDAQLNANYHLELIEWIPYDKFKDVKQIGKGGFGTIHYARWIDGVIRTWDNENQQWKRDREYCEEVALKKFDNFVNLNDVLNEMAIHLKTHNKVATIQFYGITQDPETHSYMMVLEYAKDGNLREYLKNNFNNMNWKQKLFNIWSLSTRLLNIHALDIIHQDFHPGNILSHNFDNNYLQISDYGLSKLIGANPNNPEKKNIFGVLPYIAPEVISGDEEYTKAADVYSFGIIAYEMVTGFLPYPDIPHDKDLAMKICNGLRPKIPFHIPKLITRIIMRCWDARVTYRPTFKELDEELRKYLYYYESYLDEGKNKDSEIVIQIKKADEFSAKQESTNTTTTTTPLNYQTHPQAIYTSRLLNFSKLPKPKNDENFERDLEELTESMSLVKKISAETFGEKEYIYTSTQSVKEEFNVSLKNPFKLSTESFVDDLYQKIKNPCVISIISPDKDLSEELTKYNFTWPEGMCSTVVANNKENIDILTAFLEAKIMIWVILQRKPASKNYKVGI